MKHTPPTYPTRRPQVLAAAAEALSKGEWSRLEGVPETEAALKEYHGGGIPWFISSGTAALEALMLGHEIGPGDEVITTPYTWAATVSSILAIGAIPIFADIDPQTGLIDPESVIQAVGPRTRAILAVHLFGHSCDVISLGEIAREYGLIFLEDGSQAHGAKFNGSKVGRFGDGAAFSCMGLKLLAGTEGGYALFENPEAAERAFLYGKHPRGLAPDRVEVLTNEGLLDALQLGWRPCVVSAALVRAALPFLDQENDARRSNADSLRSLLDEIPAITMPAELKGASGCYHLLSLVYHKEQTGKTREQYLQRLAELGLQGFVYIPTPIHRLKRLNPRGYSGPRVFWHEQLERAGIDYRQISCPGAEWRCENTIEFAFNWTEENPAAMEEMVGIFRAASE